MKPGYSTLIAVLLLTVAVTLQAPAWGTAVLAALAVATAAVDVLRWRHDRAAAAPTKEN